MLVSESNVREAIQMQTTIKYKPNFKSTAHILRHGSGEQETMWLCGGARARISSEPLRSGSEGLDASGIAASFLSLSLLPRLSRKAEIRLCLSLSFRQLIKTPVRHKVFNEMCLDG